MAVDDSIKQKKGNMIALIIGIVVILAIIITWIIF